MIEHHLNQQQMITVISVIANEYENSDLPDEQKLKRISNKLTDLCIDTSDIQAMYMLYVLSWSAKRALTFDDIPIFSCPLWQDTCHLN